MLLYSCLAVDVLGQLEGFDERYRRAKTEHEKRTVCIDFIDAGFVFVGSPVEDIRSVFGADFYEQGMDAESNRTAIVRFVRPSPPKIPGASVSLHGWYFHVMYRPDGTVTRYWLSNQSKNTSAQLLYEKRRKTGKHHEDHGLPIPEQEKKRVR